MSEKSYDIKHTDATRGEASPKQIGKARKPERACVEAGNAAGVMPNPVMGTKKQHSMHSSHMSHKGVR